MGTENQNIALSLAIDASVVKTPPGLLNYHTANVLRKFIANLTKTETKIKWPNDIILSKKKVSGILIETHKTESHRYFIIGIGLNVLQEDFGGLGKAGSLLTQTGKGFDLKKTAEDLFCFLSEEIVKQRSEEEILEDFNENLFRKNEVSVFELNGTRQNGIIKYADAEGFLWIDIEHSGLKRFFHKEISHLY